MSELRQRGALGQSLAETLLVVALFGVTIVAFAPFQVFLMRALYGEDPRSGPAPLSWTARQLAADARAALDSRIAPPSSVVFSLAGDRRVIWRVAAAGGVERIDQHEGHELSRAFPGTSLHVGLPAPNLFAATLRELGGRDLRLEVWLRHVRGSR